MIPDLSAPNQFMELSEGQTEELLCYIWYSQLLDHKYTVACKQPVILKLGFAASLSIAVV